MWVLPTTGRPAAAQAFLDSVAALGFAAPPTPGLVVVDGDRDPAYRALRLPPGWRIEFREESAGFLACLNRAFAERPAEPWYGLLNDDFIVRTGGWDHALIAAAGPLGFASCNDGWQADPRNPRKRMFGATMFGGDLLRALGWWSPPGMGHCYADDAWQAIAGALGNWTPCLDVMVEHRHVWTGKSEKDATHEKAYSHLEADALLWERFKRQDLGAAVERVRQALDKADPAARARADRAKARYVMIATPIARDPAVQYMLSLLRTFREFDRLGVRYECEFTCGNSNLPRARNGLVARFLASGCDDLIMIDDDMGWDPQSLLRLLASEQPLIGAVGRKKSELPNSDPSVWCAQFLEGTEGALEADAFGAVRIKRLGTAFLKVSRGVFEAMIAAHPEWKRHGHNDMSAEQKTAYHQFFRFDADDDSEEVGEDYVFCDRWRALGGAIWADPSIALKHCGVKEYEGRLLEILTPAIAEAPRLAAAE